MSQTHSPSNLPTIAELYGRSVTLYQEYEDAVCRLAEAEDTLAANRARLEEVRMDIIRRTDPKALGNNEDQRKAALAIQTETETAMTFAAGRSVELAKCEAEVARIRVRHLETVLRLVECSAAAANGIATMGEADRGPG